MSDELAHPWLRLSRRMLVVHPALEIARSLPVLIVVLLAGRGNAGNEYFGLGVAVLAALLGLVRWFTTTYRITPEQVQLRHGLLRRREVAVPRDRVRTVDVEATLFHRIVGLNRLVIGTGRSDRGDQDRGLRLDGLTTAQADALRDGLLHERHRAVPHTVDMATPSVDSPAVATSTGVRREGSQLLRFDPSWIRYGPFTLTGVVAVVAIAGLVWRGINEAHVDVATTGQAAAVRRFLRDTPPVVIGLEVLIGLLLVVAVLSTIGYVLAFWGMRVTRTGEGTLHVTRGLITTRATTLEEQRIRGVELSEPLLLRLVGGARLIAVVTGLRVGRGAERGGSLLVPPSPGAVSRRIAADVLGAEEPVSVELTRHPAAAVRRRFVRALVPATVLAAAAVALVVTIAGTDGGALLAAVVVAIVVLAAGVGLGRSRQRALGHHLTARHLTVQEGALVRRRVSLQRSAVVGVHLRATVFQRRQGLCTLQATTAAGRQAYRVLDVGERHGEILVARLLGPVVEPFLDRSGH